MNIYRAPRSTHPGLHIDTVLARGILVDFIRHEVTRIGLHRAVLGLSGGIDSALSCYLAAEALGKDHVYAVRMPYRTSSPSSYTDAQLVIDDLGVEHMDIDISAMADGLISQHPEMSTMRRGNIMARCRMTALYDQSSALNALVVGTSNKTEIMLGYSTLYGDSACALNPLGDLYKAQVRQLSKAMGVPQAIIDKVPTADLWTGQTDEEELGYRYDDLDHLLFLMIDERYTPLECIEAGFEPEFVHHVLNRVRRSQFKRIYPPVAKISHRTVGYDFLYLRDWGT